LDDYMSGNPPDGSAPLRDLIVNAYCEAAFRDITEAELGAYSRGDVAALPFPDEYVVAAGERAVRHLDAAILRGGIPRAEEGIAARRKAREDRR
jgi:hypothetical protein